MARRALPLPALSARRRSASVVIVAATALITIGVAAAAAQNGLAGADQTGGWARGAAAEFAALERSERLAAVAALAAAFLCVLGVALRLAGPGMAGAGSAEPGSASLMRAGGAPSDVRDPRLYRAADRREEAADPPAPAARMSLLSALSASPSEAPEGGALAALPAPATPLDVFLAGLHTLGEVEPRAPAADSPLVLEPARPAARSQAPELSHAPGFSPPAGPRSPAGRDPSVQQASGGAPAAARAGEAERPPRMGAYASVRRRARRRRGWREEQPDKAARVLSNIRQLGALSTRARQAVERGAKPEGLAPPRA